MCRTYNGPLLIPLFIFSIFMVVSWNQNGGSSDSKLVIRKVVFTLISLISNLISAYHKGIFYRWRRRLLTILALWRQIFKIRTARAPVVRRYWTRPGRTSAWLDNFASQTVVEEEWKENFKMSRPTFLLQCKKLRPFVQKKATNKRLFWWFQIECEFCHQTLQVVW